MDNQNNSNAFVQSYYDYQDKVRYPDNATFCPDGGNWKFAIGFRNSPLSISSRYNAKGFTRVESDPSNADVYVDSEYKGKTPLELIDISEGKHLLVLKLQGYYSVEHELSSFDRLLQEYRISLNKIDRKEEQFDLLIDKIWKKEWDNELASIVDNYKIFWDIEFRRFLKRELGLERLSAIAKDAKVAVYEKYAYEDAIRYIANFAIRKMSKDHSFLEKFEAGVKTLNKEIQCKICGKVFRPISSHHINFDVFNGDVECCNRCVAKGIWPDYNNSADNNKKEQGSMLKDLADLYGLTGIIPPSKIGYEYIKMFPKDAKAKALSLMSKMSSRDSYKSTFGSWFKSLVASGILDNASLKTSRGTKCLALDGHDCLSLLEKQFDDLLYINGIAHSKEPYYPMHTELNPNKSFRADYLINNIIIEIWGLIGEEKYDEKIEKKRIIARENKIDLIEIKPSDFINIESKIKKYFSSTKTVSNNYSD